MSFKIYVRMWLILPTCMQRRRKEEEKDITILAIYHRALLATMADYLYLYNKVVIMQTDFTYLLVMPYWLWLVFS